MARNRQRAKQRQQRRGKGPLPSPTQPQHENVPGPLEHASGEVEEFDAALISGAQGEPVAGEPDATRDELGSDAGGRSDDEPAADGPDAGRGRRSGAAEPPDGADPPATLPGVPAERGPRPEGSRIANFLRASWAELERVQWPDRRQVAQATAVVLGFVAIAGGYLGLADFVASNVVNAIL